MEKYRIISAHGFSDQDDPIWERYDEALCSPNRTHTHAQWAIIIATDEAAPDLAYSDLPPTNYYVSDSSVAQLRPPLQDGRVNQR